MGASATYGIPMLGARTRFDFSCKFFRVDEVQDCMNLRSYHYVSQDALRVVAWNRCFATPISFFCCADMCTDVPRGTPQAIKLQNHYIAQTTSDLCQRHKRGRWHGPKMMFDLVI